MQVRMQLLSLESCTPCARVGTDKQSDIISLFKALEEKNKKDKERAGMPIYENEQDEDEVEDVKPEEEDEEDDEDEDEGAVKKGKKSKFQSQAHLRLRQALSHPYCLERFFLGINSAKMNSSHWLRI